MELPRTTDLTSTEKKARVQLSSKDSSHYPQFYYWPFEKILEYTLKFTIPRSLQWENKCGQSNWDLRYQGYVDWAEPASNDDAFGGMMRIMHTQMIYSFGQGEYPEVQVKKLYAAPIERELKQRSTTAEHRALEENIFVLKYSLSPFATRYSEDFEDEDYSDDNVCVWRLITCYGETTLSTLHDRILGPAMGWSRHYHSYKFIVPTNGACFGPKNSDAIDNMHTMTSYTLDADNYQLCHVLREPSQKLVYIYDLGDSWVHTIQLLQLASKGDALQLPATDTQVRTALQKDYTINTLPKLTGVHLIAGELNCPPEDSNGCNGMGRYGNILKKGPKHRCAEASRSTNWRDHRIRNAYEFNLQAHAKRLSGAIAGKGSARSGHKKCVVPLNPSPDDDSRWNKLMDRPGPGEKKKERCLGSFERGCAPMSEIIKTRPDKENEAVCGNCGRQPNVASGTTALLRCGSCKAAWYCGKTCQTDDWQKHKERCRKMKKERLLYKKEVHGNGCDDRCGEVCEKVCC